MPDDVNGEAYHGENSSSYPAKNGIITVCMTVQIMYMTDKATLVEEDTHKDD